MIEIRVEEPTLSTLAEYRKVSIAFRVESYMRIEMVQNGLGGWSLTEEPVATPWIKDYDDSDEDRPLRWAERFDIAKWGVLAAFDGPRRVAGAAIAHDTPGVFMLEGRKDLAVLWDIRVAPEYRGQGIGSLLFTHVVAWATERRCALLKIETQNINVPACKFYAHRGCQLRAIHPDAYPDFPDEAMLLWYTRLSARAALSSV